jgi:RNA polymerase sigma-70 factor (ECF subfamily)
MGSGGDDQATGVEASLESPTARTTAPAPALFREMFDAHVSYVAATLGRLGVEQRDRDDLVSEVFVRVHRSLASYDTQRPLKPWLFAFAARVASEHRRLARHRREVFTEVDVASTALSPDQELEQSRSRRLLDRALAELDEDKREVFVLHDLDDTPVPEVARALGIPEGTAYSRLRAARAELTAAVRRLQLLPAVPSTTATRRAP